MSAGLLCDCPLPPLAGLEPSDRGHYQRVGGASGCPQYAADQERGGRCQFCADAERLRTHASRQGAAATGEPETNPYGEPDPEEASRWR
jgi:hypothetical protein